MWAVAVSFMVLDLCRVVYSSKRVSDPIFDQETPVTDLQAEEGLPLSWIRQRRERGTTTTNQMQSRPLFAVDSVLLIGI